MVFESRGVDIAPRAAKWERGRINYPPTAVEFGFRRMSLKHMPTFPFLSPPKKREKLDL